MRKEQSQAVDSLGRIGDIFGDFRIFPSYCYMVLNNRCRSTSLQPPQNFGCFYLFVVKLVRVHERIYASTTLAMFIYMVKFVVCDRTPEYQCLFLIYAQRLTPNRGKL
jgi:hypothetical protein